MIVVSFRAKVGSGDVAFGVVIVAHGGCTNEASIVRESDACEGN